MRFFPTANTVLAANDSIFRVIEWKAYYRIVSSLNGAINDSNFIECTDRIATSNIGGAKFPELPSRAELSLGISSIDSINIELDNIQWWYDNVFSIIDNKNYWCEFKIEGRIGQTIESLTSDIFYMFTGFFDENPDTSESQDSVTVRVFSFDDQMNNVPSEFLVTQYLNKDIDSLGLQGLFTIYILEFFVTDCNQVGTPLKIGVHTVTYEYNGGMGNQRAKLDDGNFVTIGGASSAFYTLYNSSLTQSIQVYVRSKLRLLSLDYSFKLYVFQDNTQFPFMEYQGISASRAIELCLAEVGIETYESTPTFSIPTWDNRNTVSFLEIPASQYGTLGNKNTIISMNGFLYMGIENKIYKRLSSFNYEIVATLPVGYVTSRLARATGIHNNYMFINCGLGTGNGKLYRLDILTNTLSAEIDLPTNVQGWQVYDYLGLEFSVLFVKTFTPSRDLIRIDGLTLVKTTLFTNIGSTQSETFKRSTNVFLHTPSTQLEEYMFNGVSWVFNGVIATLDVSTFPAYHEAENTLYYDRASSIRSHNLTTDVKTDIYTKTADEAAQNFYYDPVLQRVFCYINFKDIRLLSMKANVVTEEQFNICGNSIFHMMVNHLGNTHGLDFAGRLWIYDNVFYPYIKTLSVEKLKIKDVYTKITRAFNVLSRINFNKVGKYILRFTDTGTLSYLNYPLLVLNNENVETVDTVKGYITGIEFVSVKSENVTVTYNGTDFNVEIYDTTIRKMEVDNDYIPVEFLYDMAYWFFIAFSKSFDLVKIGMANQTVWYHEVFDGVSIDIVTPKLTIQSIGTIYEFISVPEGNTKLNILVEA